MRLFFLIATFLLSIKVYSQDSLDRKYLLSLLYLKSDRELNEAIKETFSYCIHKKVRVVDFKIHDDIWFHRPSYFEFKIA